MKNRKHFGWTGALLMAASLCAFTPGLTAQAANSGQQQEQPDQAQPQGQPQSETYAGTVMKLQNGKYALVIGKTAQGQLAGHFLDDPNDAQKYEGKKVRVTGTLDMASNTIHVTKIVAA
jgi:hypothetical protein